MYEKICEILLNYVEEPETGLTPETTFIEDLGMSSLDVMTMVGDLEDEFGVEIETAGSEKHLYASGSGRLPLGKGLRRRLRWKKEKPIP